MKVKNLPRASTLQKLLLLSIFVVGVAIRFYQLDLRVGMGDDSVRDAFVAQHAVQTAQLPMTGPFSSLGPFTFGPWYYYQLTAFTAVVRHPFAPWIYMALASSLFILIMYGLGAYIAGPTYGLIVALFVALSPPQISAAKGLTNPNLIPLHAGLALWIVLRLTKEDLSPKWGLFLGLLLGMGLNIHYQMVGLLVLPAVLLIYKRKKIVRHLILMMLGIFITFLPMLMFELTNHWYTTRNMTYFYMYGKNVFYIPNRWLFYLRDFWPDFIKYLFGIPKSGAVALIAGFLVVFAWQIKKRALPTALLLILVAFGVNFIMLRYYWGERFMGYLQFFHPYLFLLAGYTVFVFFKSSKTAFIGLGILVLFIATITPMVKTEFGLDSVNMQARRDMKLITEEFPNQKFRIYSCKHRAWANSQALAYFLYSNGLLADDGIAVGFWDGQCGYPPTPDINPTGAASVEAQNQTLYPRLNLPEAINLTHATPSALLSSEWGVPITPEFVYNTTVRWWFKEQP